MNNTLKKLFCGLAATAMLSCAYGQVLSNESDELKIPEKRPNYVMTGDQILIPEGFPLRLVDASGREVGELGEFEHREKHFVLQNTSDKPVKIAELVPGCPCVSLKESIANRVLAPQETLKVDYTIFGSKLNAGAFDRVLFINVEGFPIVKLGMVGTVVRRVSVSPDLVIDLGTFTGELPLKRTFKIKSLFEDDRLVLSKPEENPYFSYELRKTAPKEYELDVLLKTPILKRALRETILIPASGVANYGPVEVGIVGKITGLMLKADPLKRYVQLATLETGKPVVIDTKISQIMLPEKKVRNSAAGEQYQPAAPEEAAMRPMNLQKTWEAIAKEVIVDNYPEEATVEKVCLNDGIIIRATFPADYFAHPNHKFTTMRIYRGRKVLGISKIYVR